LTRGVIINILRKILHQIIGWSDRVWNRGLMIVVLQYIKWKSYITVWLGSWRSFTRSQVPHFATTTLSYPSFPLFSAHVFPAKSI
jgi:hypothetical protein